VGNLHLNGASQLIRGVGPHSTGSGGRPGLRLNGHGDERGTDRERLPSTAADGHANGAAVCARPSPSAGATNASVPTDCPVASCPLFLRASPWTEGMKRHSLRSQVS